MASYILYTYQFAPIINDGANLFQPMPEVEQRMESKQTYLQEILLNANFKFNSKEKVSLSINYVITVMELLY